MQAWTGLTRWNAVRAVLILGSDLASRVVLVRRSEAEEQWKKDAVLSPYRFFFPTLFGYIHKFGRDGEIHRMAVEEEEIEIVIAFSAAPPLSESYFSMPLRAHTRRTENREQRTETRRAHKEKKKGRQEENESEVGKNIRVRLRT